MSRVAVSREKLVAVADAVRAKTGGTESLTLDEMIEKISSIGAEFINVATLPGFNGIPTGIPGEYRYAQVSNDSVWVASLYIPFDGVLGEEYAMTAFVKSEGATMFGVGFVYEDGSTQNSGRYNDEGSWRAVSVTSNKSKKVVAVGTLYGSSGPGLIRKWYIQRLGDNV